MKRNLPHLLHFKRSPSGPCPRLFMLRSRFKLVWVHSVCFSSLAIKTWPHFSLKITFRVQNYHSSGIFSACSTTKAQRQTLKPIAHGNSSWKECSPTNLTNIWLNQRPLETAEAAKGIQLLKWQPIIKLPLAWDTVIPQMLQSMKYESLN